MAAQKHKTSKKTLWQHIRRHGWYGLFLVLGLAGLILVGGFVVDHYVIRQNQVARNVVLGSQSLAGMSRAELAEMLTDRLDALAQEVRTVSVRGTNVDVIGADLFVDHDADMVVDQIMQYTRGGNIFSQFRAWFYSWSAEHSVDQYVLADQVARQQRLEEWRQLSGLEEPLPAWLGFDNGVPVAMPPQPGWEFERDQLWATVVDVFFADQQGIAVLPVQQVQLPYNEKSLASHLATLRTMVGGDFRLYQDEFGIERIFTRDELSQLITVEAVEPIERSRYQFGIDMALIDEWLGDFIAQDAYFEYTDDYQVTIVPERYGYGIDREGTQTGMVRALQAPNRQLQLTITDQQAPDILTSDLEELGVKHLVASFTTYHSCCQDRVTNIQLMADKIDDTRLAPGEEFSLNQAVGERTEQEGFQPAGTIVAGQLIDTVGGGVSQLATTLYNAIFWGGYDEVVHSPHSWYFSRYPKGIEATVSWPVPDLKFRNDTENTIIVDASYTDTSITVSIYGDNDGHIIIGSQKHGRTNVEVVDPGGELARLVTAETDFLPSSDLTTPTKFIPGDVGYGDLRVVEKGQPGQRLSISRTITVGEESVTETWPVRYRARPRVVMMHPCFLPAYSRAGSHNGTDYDYADYDCSFLSFVKN